MPTKNTSRGKPIPGVVYRLTGGPDEPSVARGDQLEDCVVPDDLPEAIYTVAGEVVDVPVIVLKANPLNVRLSLGAGADLEALAASIKREGVLMPLRILPDRTIVCGHRRRTAATMAGLATVPCVIVPMTEQEQIEAMISENLRRVDITPLEEANAFQMLLGLAPSETVAERTGLSVEAIDTKTAVLRLPAATRAMYAAGVFTDAAATELLALLDHPDELDKCAASAAAQHGWKQDAKTGAWTSLVDSEPVHHIWNVRTVLDEIVKKEKIAALKAEAKKQGYKVVSLPQYGNTPGGTIRINHNDVYSSARLTLDRKALTAHKKLPCHALAIVGTELVNVCTSPADHGDAYKPPPVYNSGHDPEEYRRRNEERQRIREGLDAGEEERIKSWRAIADRMIGEKELHFAVMALAVSQRDWSDDPVTGAILGLAYDGHGDASRAIVEYIVGKGDGDGDVRRMQAVLAAATLAKAETSLGDAYRGWTTAPKVSAAILLREAGHVWNEVEAERWAEVADAVVQVEGSLPLQLGYVSERSAVTDESLVDEDAAEDE